MILPAQRFRARVRAQGYSSHVQPLETDDAPGCLRRRKNVIARLCAKTAVAQSAASARDVPLIHRLRKIHEMFKNILAAATLAFTLALPAFAATPVNINTADAATIANALDGIGLAKAKAIVAFRDEHGPFKNVDDLTQVKGIGQATLQRNHEAILLTGQGATPEEAAASKAKHPKKPKPATAGATEG
jgi:competence protein ComEA